MAKRACSSHVNLSEKKKLNKKNVVFLIFKKLIEILVWEKSLLLGFNAIMYEYRLIVI